MTDLNHVNLIGRITRTVGEDQYSFTHIGNGMAKAIIPMAVNRSKKNGDQWIDEVSYFDVTLWGDRAEKLKKYLTKGQQIAVDGYLKQDRWEKDGQKYSRVSITADMIYLLGKKDDNETNNNNGYKPRQQQPVNQEIKNDPSVKALQETGLIQENEIFNEDIPF